MGLIDNINIAVDGAQDSSAAQMTYETVVLKQGTPLSRQMNKANTKYVLKWNFVMDDDIVMPEGCLIEFDGGSISNEEGKSYTITGTDTILIYEQKKEDVIKNVSLLGTWQQDMDENKYDNTDGMARIVLVKGKPLSEQMTVSNCIYVVRYDFELGDNLTVPENCVLEFEGGSISGAYTLTGQNTEIIANDVAIFTGIHIDGIWKVTKIRSYWFSDITSTNRLRELINLSNDNIFNEIYIAEGNYILYADPNEAVDDPLSDFYYPSCIRPKSNTRLIIDGNLNLVATDLDGYRVINLYHVNNIEISGHGGVFGDKFTHTGTTGESGHCIFMKKCNFINIHDLYINAPWGDCICIGGGNSSVVEDVSTYITIKRCRLLNGRRQGISVIHGELVNIEDCYIASVSGHDPQAGIDLEPNPDVTYNRNITIRNCSFKLTGIGILIYGQRYVSGNSGDTVLDNTKNMYISIDNCFVANTKGNSLRIDSCYDVKITNSYFGTTTTSTINSLVINGGQYINICNCTIDGIRGLVNSGSSLSGNISNSRLVLKENTTLVTYFTHENTIVEGPISSTVEFRNSSNGLKIVGMYCSFYNKTHTGLTIQVNNGLNRDIIKCYFATIVGCKIINNVKDVASYAYMLLNGSSVYGLIIENASDSLRIQRLAEVSGNVSTPSTIVGVTFVGGINRTVECSIGSNTEFSFIDNGKMTKGTTTQRPIFAYPGFCYYDTDLRKPIYVNNLNNNTGEILDWRDADGVMSSVVRIGNTASRPTGQYKKISRGFMYFDTTLGKPIFAKEVDTETSPYTVTWVDATGATV